MPRGRKDTPALRTDRQTLLTAGLQIVEVLRRWHPASDELRIAQQQLERLVEVWSREASPVPSTVPELVLTPSE